MIPQAYPKADYLAHKTEIDEAIRRTLDSGWYVLGREVETFEQEFANYIGSRYAIGVANGTDALQLALRACGIGSGDAVITVSHTAVATVAAIELAGATPVLVDIDPDTFTVDVDCLEDAIKKQSEGRWSAVGLRIKAMIPVHLYGHPADMPAIMDIAERYGLYVIEDCAQSHGAVIQGKKTGAWGHISAFSFYPTKNLGALGDGGAVVTNDSELAERSRSLREYGWRERHISDFPGMNSRLDELQAAVLRVKLELLDEENVRRRQIAQIYYDKLSATALSLPLLKDGAKHVYHQYVVRSEKRDSLRAFLKASSIPTSIHYPVPVHFQPAYRNRLASFVGSLQRTERLCHEILSLPIHPHMTDDHVLLVCESIARWHAEKTGKS